MPDKMIYYVFNSAWMLQFANIMRYRRRLNTHIDKYTYERNNQHYCPSLN